MGGRRSPQALAPIVKRIPAKVLVHAEPADAAAVATGRRGRPAAEDRIVTAAAAAAFDATAAHQRRNRWHRFARPQGGKVTPSDAIPPLEQIARIIVAVVVVEGVPKSIHNAIAKERWRRRRWIRIPGVHWPIAEPTFGKEQPRALLGPVAGASAPVALLRIAHAGLRSNATRRDLDLHRLAVDHHAVQFPDRLVHVPLRVQMDEAVVPLNIILDDSTV